MYIGALYIKRVSFSSAFPFTPAPYANNSLPLRDAISTTRSTLTPLPTLTQLLPHALPSLPIKSGSNAIITILFPVSSPSSQLGQPCNPVLTMTLKPITVLEVSGKTCFPRKSYSYCQDSLPSTSTQFYTSLQGTKL